jgi:hypothetical protein
MVELPLLAKMYNQLHPQGFEFFAVTLKRTTPKMIRDLAAEHKMTFTFLQDETGPGNVYTPDTYHMGLMGYVAIVDKQGRVRHFFDNWSSGIDVVARYSGLIKKLMAEE